MPLLDRETLYKQVWTVPVTQLALKYGISDVGLAKVCRRYLIPRPPRGYWARLQSGQRPHRPPLPPTNDPKLQRIRIIGGNMSDATMSINPNNRDPRERIVVGTALSEPHFMVEGARQQLESATSGPAGLLESDPQAAVDIRVRLETVNRALRVWDAFAKAWEREGGQIRPETYLQRPCTGIAIKEDFVPLHLTETTDPIRYGRRAPEAPPLSNPRLCFIVGDGRLGGIKGIWGDTTTVRLEKVIRPLIDAIRNYLVAQRQVRLDAECEKRQQSQAQTVRRARADEAKEEFYLRQDLLKEVDRWHKATQIRQYLAAVKQKIDAGTLKPTDQEGFTAWMKWADWFANDMDPLARVPTEDRVPILPRNVPAAELDLTSRARALVNQLGVKDSDELWRVPEEQIRELSGWNSGMWRELTLVLEGLGYDVDKRKSSYYW